ncbi:MAG: adenylate/guanylate cyclase domain-containing protein [Gammaproteobacteria bacterium]|nr:adenylate/guanylate cyclase domain-containing protein [Gammaproteobacteria bacterium]
MSDNDREVAILIADISGSVALYDDVGDTDALRLVGICLDNLRAIVKREGGTFIRSKGDDVLAVFSDPSAALKAARAMLSQEMTGPSLAIHVGASFGHVIPARGDVFGDAVHMTARLAALAKPGEILANDSFVEQLPEADRRWLQPLDNVTLKGKNAPTKVYTLLEEDSLMRTVVGSNQTSADTRTHERTVPDVTVTLRYADKTFACPERTTLSIGRSTGNDVVIAQPWISREHAKLSVRRGKVQLADQSSSGTYVSVQPDYEFLLKRETVLLMGSGIICPGVRPTAPEAEVIHYEVTIRQPIAAP